MAAFGAHGPKGVVIFLAFWIMAMVPVLPRLGGGAIGVIGWVLLIGGGLALAATVMDEVHGVVLGILALVGRSLGGWAGGALGLADGAYQVARVSGALLLPGALMLAVLAYFARLDRRMARAAAESGGAGSGGASSGGASSGADLASADSSGAADDARD